MTFVLSKMVVIFPGDENGLRTVVQEDEFLDYDCALSHLRKRRFFED